MFVNAVIRPYPLDPIRLTPEARTMQHGEWMKVCTGRIERWKTMAFFNASREAFEAGTGYQIEKKLCAGEPIAFPFERPRLFDRMEQGQPIAYWKHLMRPYLPHPSRKRAATCYWLTKAVGLKPQLRGVAREPIWSLLHPRSLDPLSWKYLSETHRHRAATCGLNMSFWRVPLANDGESPRICLIPNAAQGSRLGLERVLLEMRRWEMKSNLIGFYLNFLEALDRCRAATADTSLSFMQKECEQHLLQCFAHVHVGSKRDTNYLQHIDLLEAARQRFLDLKGSAKSPDESALTTGVTLL